MKKLLLSAVAAGALVGLCSTAWADIVIGVAGPMTGPGASFGAQFQKGAEHAAADINAAGGVLGQKIVIQIGDDVSDPKQGISVANKFVADGVKFVVGHYNSSISIPASEIYAENGVLEISPSSTNPQYTERGLWNTFRTCGRDDQQGTVAAQYIAEHFKNAKIAYIHNKELSSQGLVDQTKSILDAKGIKDVMYEGINVGDKDFSTLISKIKESGADFVYYGGLHTEAGLILRQMADQGMRIQFFSGDGIVSSELAAIAGDSVIGVMNTFPADARNNPTAKAIVDKFRAEGFEPEAFTLYSYSAVQVIAEAIKKLGSADDAQKVAETLKSGGPWSTAIGSISYDSKGDNTRPDFVVYEWKKGPDGQIGYFQK